MVAGIPATMLVKMMMSKTNMRTQGATFVFGKEKEGRSLI